MKQDCRPCKADWKSRETFMFSSFPFSASVCAKRVQKTFWGNCDFYMSVQ